MILLCFLLSGLTALVYQTAWTREFSFVFGTSELAVATVLAAYMGGLAVGSAAAAPLSARVRRPVLVYGLLELGIGVCAFLVPMALRGATPLYVALFGGGSEAFGVGGLPTALFYVACSFAILLLPTAFMGATLPLLARQAVRHERELGSRVGALYAINTLGAVVGTLLSGFVLLPSLGLRATVWIAVALNVLVFVLAVLASRGALPPPPPVARAARPSFREGGWVLPAILLSGMVSFAFEVLWTRLLGHLLGGSVYAFSTMLATFLVGIAVGSAVAARLARDPPRAALGFAAAQIGTALLSLAAYRALDSLPELARSLTTSTTRLVADAAVAALTLLPSTLCIGASFPFAVRILGRSDADAGPVSARVYSWNTLGAIAGALGGGFFLIPALGYEGTLATGAALNLSLAIAAALLARAYSGRLVAAALAAGLILTLVRPTPPWSLLKTGPLGLAPRKGEVTFYSVGRSATVLLLDEGDFWNLTTNGLPESTILRKGSAANRSPTAHWLSSLPVLARPETRSMLVVGLGGGVVVERIPGSVERIDVVELEPEVVQANRAVSAQRMRDPLADPRVRIHENDARGALVLTNERFDAIVSQPSHPWTAGASNLYTREFFELARDRLTPGGVFTQWMGAQFVDEELLRILLATLLDVFPNVRVYHAESGSVVFVASQGPLPVEETSGRALAQDPDAFAYFGLRRPEQVAAALMLDEAGARRFAGAAPVSTDERNYLRTRSPQIVRNVGRRKGTSRDFEVIFAKSGLIPAPAPGLDAMAVLEDRLQRRLLQIAELQALAFSDPAERATARALLTSRKAPLRAVAELRQALQLDSANPAARAAVLRLWRAGVAPAREIAVAWPDPRPEEAVVIRGLQRLKDRDPDRLRALEPELAAVSLGDRLAPEALRLRAGWRMRTGEPAAAREALALLTLLDTLDRDRGDLVLRAEAAHLAGDPYAAFSSLRAALAGVSRDRLPPRLLSDARALFVRLEPEVGWDRWKRELRDALYGPAKAQGGSSR